MYLFNVERNDYLKTYMIFHYHVLDVTVIVIGKGIDDPVKILDNAIVVLPRAIALGKGLNQSVFPSQRLANIRVGRFLASVKLKKKKNLLTLRGIF